MTRLSRVGDAVGFATFQRMTEAFDGLRGKRLRPDRTKDLGKVATDQRFDSFEDLLGARVDLTQPKLRIHHVDAERSVFDQPEKGILIKAKLLFGPQTRLVVNRHLDDQRGRLRQLLDVANFTGIGFAHSAVMNRQRAQNLAGGGQDREGPAGTHTVLARQWQKWCPPRVGVYIGHDHRAPADVDVAVPRHLRADDEAVGRDGVDLASAAGRLRPQVRFLAIGHDDGAARIATCVRLGSLDDRREHRADGRAADHELERLLLAGQA